MVDVSTPASSSSSDADSGPRNGSAVTRSPALEDSEDDLVVEAEVLSIEEKKLLVEVCVSNVLDTYMWDLIDENIFVRSEDIATHLHFMRNCIFF